MTTRAIDRCWQKVGRRDDSDGCWEWLGHCTKDGYGKFKVAGKDEYTHRYLHTVLAGPIADGLQLHHICENRRCVNPAHLLPVTQREHTRLSPNSRAYSNKTHCPQGHPYNETNTYYRANGYRDCRECHILRSRRNRRRGMGRVAVDSAPELFWESGENLVAAPRDIVSQSRHTPEQRELGMSLLMGKGRP